MTRPEAEHPVRCLRCGKRLKRRAERRGRPRQYCRPACRVAAHKARARQAVAAPVEDRSDWWTPEWLRRLLYDRWNLTFDACATRPSALTSAYAGPDQVDGLRDSLSPDVDWGKLAGLGGVVYACPPFTPTADLERFLAKCAATARSGTSCVAVVPSQDGAIWWDEHVLLAGASWTTVVGRFPFAGPHSAGGSPRWAVAVVEWPAGVEPVDPEDPDQHHVRRSLGRIVAPRARRGAVAAARMQEAPAVSQACASRATGLIVPVHLSAREGALGLAEFTDDDLGQAARLRPGDQLCVQPGNAQEPVPAVVEAVQPGRCVRYRVRFTPPQSERPADA